MSPSCTSGAALLPAAVKSNRSGLSAEGKKALADLTGPRPWAFTGQLFMAWLVIAGAIAAAVVMAHPLVTVLAILLVATRMNVLGLLVHDQAHLLGYRHRHGDTLVNLFAGYPLMVLSVEGYAAVHLAHHRDYFQSTDPDFVRKSGPEWTFPMPVHRLLRLFLTDILGINTIKLFKGKRAAAPNVAFARRHPTPKWVRAVFLLGLIAVLTFTHNWLNFLLFWMLPLVTVLPAIVRWGAICEHRYNLPGASVEDSTPVIIPGLLGRVLLPNLNFSLHVYHHFHPGVSFANLPRVHAIYEREGLVDEGNLFRGYLTYWRSLTAMPPGDPAESGDSRVAPVSQFE